MHQRAVRSAVARHAGGPAPPPRSISGRRPTRALANLPFASIGACAYVGTAALPWRWGLPLLVLGICAALSTLRRSRRPAAPPLGPAVLLVLVLTALSLVAGRPSAESLQLSAPLLPAALLFFVISGRFDTTRDVTHLFLCFSLVALGLSVWLLWNAWLDGWVSPNVWALHARSPLVVVGNDVTFLAVVAPLTLALMCGDAPRAVKLLCAASIALSVVAIGAFSSRGALLALAVSLGCAAWLIRRRLLVAVGLALVVSALVIDGALGFPLAAKLTATWTHGVDGGRLDLWQVAWRTFVEAPWFGHGHYATVYTTPDRTEAMRWAHNLYLDVLVGQGVIGFAAFVFLLGRAWSVAWRTHAVAAGAVRVLNAGALAALIGFGLSGVYETSLIRLWAVMSLFGLLGVIAHLSIAATTTPEESP